MQNELREGTKALETYLPGIRDRLLISLIKFGQPGDTERSDCIGMYHQESNKIELDIEMDKHRMNQTFWHETWHMIEAQFKDIKGSNAEEIKADLFGQFMSQLLGPNAFNTIVLKHGSGLKP